MLSEDVAWHVPGESAIAGDHRGIDDVLAYFAKRRELARGTLRITPGSMLADGQQVVHLADGDATIDGRRRHWQTVSIFRISKDRIAECWYFPSDQHEFDETWAG